MKCHPVRHLAGIPFAFALIVSFGCPVQQPTPNPSNGQQAEVEPNNTFDQANPVTFDSSGAAHLVGTISRSNDVDVYSLGPMSAGDRIVVDVGTTGNLDSEAGIFDDAQRIAFENDDRDINTNNLNPFLNEVIRHDSSVYYLVIQAAPLGANNTMTGPYDVNLQMTRGGQVPPTEGQIVVLDFGGGTITIPGDNTYTVGLFNTGDIDPAYTGMTTVVRQQIVAVVKQRYTGLNMDIRSKPGDVIPAAGTYSDVLFGGQNPQAFGISQDVDPYNQNHADGSIIFTNVFNRQTFGRVLTATELGTAIGNVAAHEIGHLLGLNHVDDIQDLMDTTGGPDTLLANQQFMTAPLDPSIFFLGLQDGSLLLDETLGTKP